MVVFFFYIAMISLYSLSIAQRQAAVDFSDSLRAAAGKLAPDDPTS